MSGIGTLGPTCPPVKVFTDGAFSVEIQGMEYGEGGVVDI